MGPHEIVPPYVLSSRAKDYGLVSREIESPPDGRYGRYSLFFFQAGQQEI